MLEELLSLMSHRGLVDAAMVVGILLIAFGRPSRIRSLHLFRFAVLLFAASLVMPMMNQFVLMVLDGSGGAGGFMRGGAGSGLSPYTIMLGTVPVVLLAGSLCCLVESIRPRMTEDEERAAMKAKTITE